MYQDSSREKRSSTKYYDLLGDIENFQTKRVRIASNAIWSLGGAGCVIRVGRCLIYIDPYLSVPDPSNPFHRAIPVPFPPEKIREANAILSTHEHADHCDEHTIKAFQSNTNAVFIGPLSSTAKALAWGYKAERVITMRPGDNYEVAQEIRILSLDSSDPYAESALTYLVKTPLASVFHSGDSSYFNGFRKIGQDHKVDVALLNFGKQIPTPEKPYYMNAEAVASAARDLNAKIVIPMHWDMWFEAKDDPVSIKDRLEAMSPSSQLLILNVGERFEF